VCPLGIDLSFYKSVYGACFARLIRLLFTMRGLDGWEHMLCISMGWVGYVVSLIRSHLVAKAGLQR
jgi:hypothetical protein